MTRVLSSVLFNLLLLLALTASAAESVLIVESSAVDKALRLQFFFVPQASSLLENTPAGCRRYS